MLHQQDSKLVMMHPDQENKLHVMDLEYGKVVDEWHVEEHIPIQDIIPDKKYAQLTGSQTMVGINSKAMFQIDGRLDKNKMVSSSLSQYKTKVGFSAATTTGDGRIAVASEKGEIRLFDRFGLSRAKTTLPGVGDPIIGMDTTEDGKVCNNLFHTNNLFSLSLQHVQHISWLLKRVPKAKRNQPLKNQSKQNPKDYSLNLNMLHGWDKMFPLLLLDLIRVKIAWKRQSSHLQALL